MDRRQLLVGSAGLAGALLASPALAAPRTRKPNFIVIYCDDLGFGDVGPMGGTAIPTPHLDRMAREGVTLTDYYAPANVCTPSRAGLLTGRYPVRTTMSRVLLEADKTGLPLSEVTIAKALKPDYASALIGKWHLGHQGPSWPPTAHGFDLFHGIPYSHDITPLKLYEFTQSGGAVGEWPVDFPRLQQNFAQRAAQFIADNHDRPFFLELALSSPHLPNFPAPGLAGKSAKAGAYGDTVIEIDGIVGALLAQLRQLRIDQDTMVIFTSDNGPWFEGSTGGMRQRKGGGGYDGGYRVPFIARWPGRIQPGKRSDAIAMGIDLLPTFCGLAGIAPPAGVALDGKDISAVLTRGAPSPHDALLLFQDEQVVAIRTQRWKYVIADFYMNYQVYLEARGYPQLYDMRERGEQYSVASLHPDVARAMRAQIAAADQEFSQYRRPGAPVLSDQAKMGPKREIPEIWRD